MCFSATASFTAGTVLLGGGAIALKSTKTRSHIPFAAIPVVFAMQQFTEGILWLSFTHPGLAHFAPVLKYTFLTFAQVVWPVLIPLSIMLIEKDPRRKKNLEFLTKIGILTSLLMALRLSMVPVTSVISSHHITYGFETSVGYTILCSVLYLASTCLPFFVSTMRKIHLLGLLNVSSLAITVLFFGEKQVLSTWCFFAAIMSAVIVSIVISLPNIGNRSFSGRSRLKSAY